VRGFAVDRVLDTLLTGSGSLLAAMNGVTTLRRMRPAASTQQTCSRPRQRGLAAAAIVSDVLGWAGLGPIQVAMANGPTPTMPHDRLLPDQRAGSDVRDA
jgi:hypothetical protein